MDWQPTLSWQNAQKRAQVISQIRDFFKQRKVLEVETPALSQGTVTDVYLDALSCEYNFLPDSSDQHSDTLYLQTSPEFHMKRLLASGYGCIYQIAKAYRHEEFGRYHNPEFTMLEWYRIGFDQFDLMHEVADLLKGVLDCAEVVSSSYQEIFIDKVSIDPLTSSFADLNQFLVEQGKSADWLSQSGDKDLLLQFIFTEIIEPQIGINEPQFIYNFPVAQASLAQVCPEDARVAQRFECYYRGVELANGFNELTNANEQLARFKDDNQKRAAQGLVEKPIDERFIAALSSGLPECSGVALGIDRLIMLAINADTISDVQSFGVDRA